MHLTIEEVKGMIEARGYKINRCERSSTIQGVQFQNKVGRMAYAIQSNDPNQQGKFYIELYDPICDRLCDRDGYFGTKKEFESALTRLQWCWRKKLPK
jgi:hypothetical protein